MNYQTAKKWVRVTRRVRGYLAPEALYLLAMLDEIQKQQGVQGSLFEIGIFHGKSLIMMAALKAANESLGFCDMRSKYVEAAQLNLARWVSPEAAAEVRVFCQPSTQLTTADFAPTSRLIHIDGSHESDDVAADLHLTLQVLHPEGLIVMDDVFNETYPGVVDGLRIFHEQSPDALVPVIQGFGKTILCRPEARDRYFAWFQTGGWQSYLNARSFRTRVTKFLGREVFVFVNDDLRKIRYRLLGGYAY